MICYNFISSTECEVTSGGHYSGEIVIPEKVTSNGKEYTVTSIGEKAFYYCRSLTSVSIPNTVTTIGYEAFYNCEWLTSVNIPQSVTNIGDGAFLGTRIISVTIPNGVTIIGEDVFNGCDEMTTITIPNSVTSIGRKAFYNCQSLTSINIPNSVTTIGELAFYDCNLNSITLPNSVTSIGANAFDRREAPFISTVISLIEKPFDILGKSSYDKNKKYAGVFSKNTFNNATLYVPKGAIEKYKATFGWQDFVFIKENTDETGIQSIDYLNEIKGIYSLSGKMRKTAQLQ
jgi:hypothetical protein